MVSQSLQSSLSSPNFPYLKQFPQKEGRKKKYPSYKNAGIVTWVVKQQIVVNQSFFCDACPENPALCIEPCFKLHHEPIKNRIYEE